MDNLLNGKFGRIQHGPIVPSFKRGVREERGSNLVRQLQIYEPFHYLLLAPEKALYVFGNFAICSGLFFLEKSFYFFTPKNKLFS
jgi:hypothetical protein